MINELKIYFKDKYMSCITAFVVGITIYLPSMVLRLSNPDGYWNSETFKINYNWENALGRFGLRYVGRLLGSFSSSFLSIPINIFLLVIIGGLISSLLNINKKSKYLLITLLLMFSMSMSTTLSYHYSSVGYILSFLFSVIPVYIIFKTDNYLYTIISAILLTISISLYQAYIAVTIFLIIIKLIQLLLIDLENNEIIKYIAKSLIFGILGTSLYLLIAKNSQILFGVALDSGRGFSTMGNIGISQLPILISRAYTNWFDYYFTNNFITNSWYFKNIINIILYVSGFLAIIYIIYKNNIYKDKFKIILLTLIILTLPIALAIMSILSPEALSTDVTGLLMVPQTILFYVLIIVIFEEIKFKYIKPLMISLISLFLFIQIIYTTIFQSYMETSMRQSYTIANTMFTKISEEYGYTPGMKVAIINKPSNFYLDLANEHQRYILKGTPIVDGMFWSDHFGQQSSWINFLKNYMGIDFSYVLEDEFNNLISKSEFNQMGSFPNENSMVKKQDAIIIKLGD